MKVNTIVMLKELVRKVELYSKKNSFSLAAFKALRETEVNFCHSTFTNDILSIKELPRQYYGKDEFGDFNITLLIQGRIEIHLYIMNEIHTNIHDHPFIGAFKILEGESLNVDYEFSKEKDLEEGLSLGKLNVKGSALLKRSSVVEITQEKIHSLFRLKKENVSLLILQNTKNHNHTYLWNFLRVRNGIKNFETFERKLDFLEKFTHKIKNSLSSKSLSILLVGMSKREQVCALLLIISKVNQNKYLKEKAIIFLSGILEKSHGHNQSFVKSESMMLKKLLKLHGGNE